MKADVFFMFHAIAAYVQHQIIFQLHDTCQQSLHEYSFSLCAEDSSKNVVCFWYVNTGKYKVEIFDRQQNLYVPSVSGLGMHVDVKDPEDKTVLSRVSATFSIIFMLVPWHVLVDIFCKVFPFSHYFNTAFSYYNLLYT